MSGRRGRDDAEPGAVAPPSLIPWWFTAGVLGLLGAVFLLAGGVGLLGGSATAVWMRFLAVATGGGLLAAGTAFLSERRPERLEPGPDGRVVLTSPLGVAVGLVVALVATMAMAGAGVWFALTVGLGPDTGGALLLGLLSLGLVPEVFRLLTGRLHRWRVEIGPEGLRYRGYRTDLRTTWTRVRDARVQPRHPAGVLVRTADGDVVLPAAVFPVPPHDLAEVIHARRRGRTT